MRIQAIQTGTLSGNETFFRGGGWTSLLRSRRDVEFPAFAFVLERDDGLIAVDTGLSTRVRVPRAQRRVVPVPRIAPQEELGPRMRAAGLDPADVHTVVVTHLDWDHAGGLGFFPGARVLVHRPELEFARRLPGRLRYQAKLWPEAPSLESYDLGDEPLGPFPRSKALTDDGAIQIVPLAGHSAGQVGVLVQGERPALLLCADHCLRADWFAEDLAVGNEIALGVFFRDRAVETSRRIQDLARERPLVLLPSHDAETPDRLRDPGAWIWSPPVVA